MSRAALIAAALILVPFWLLAGGSYVYWNHIYWPVKEKGYEMGVYTGIAMSRCGVNPPDGMAKVLSHFVDGDVATRDCTMLQHEAKKLSRGEQ